MTAVLTVTMNPSIDISASVEKMVPTIKLRCAEVRRDPGGGGINVARVVNRLGGDCRALYPAGGSPGRLLERLLDIDGITSLPVEIAADTRESFTVEDEAAEDQYRFVLPGPELSTAEWRNCLGLLESVSPAPAYVVASGSLPPGVPADFYARVARTARRLGARVVVDTSGRALAAALEEGVHLVKPNLRELRELTGEALERESDWADAAAGLVRSGKAEAVALSLGEQGALLVGRDVRLRAGALPVDIVSAVGAGDSFVAAMVWRLSSDSGLKEAFRYGVAAGSAALLTPGTELCRKEDVERLSGQVELFDLEEVRPPRG